MRQWRFTFSVKDDFQVRKSAAFTSPMLRKISFIITSIFFCKKQIHFTLLIGLLAKNPSYPMYPSFRLLMIRSKICVIREIWKYAQGLIETIRFHVVVVNHNPHASFNCRGCKSHLNVSRDLPREWYIGFGTYDSTRGSKRFKPLK